MKGSSYPPVSQGQNTLSYKVAHSRQNQSKHDNVTIPVNQITKITR